MTAESDAAWYAFRGTTDGLFARRADFEAGWNAAAERANTARQLEREQPPAIDRSALAKLLDDRIPAHALVYEQLDALIEAVLALVQPADGVTLSREDAQYVRRLMWAKPVWDEQEAAFHERLERTLDADLPTDRQEHR